MVHFTNLDPQVNSTRPQLNAAQFYSKNNTGIKKNILQVNTNLYNTDPWHAKRKKTEQRNNRPQFNAAQSCRDNIPIPMVNSGKRKISCR